MKAETVQGLIDLNIETEWCTAVDATRHRSGYIWTVEGGSVDIPAKDMLSFRRVQTALFKASSQRYVLPQSLSSEWERILRVLGQTADYDENYAPFDKLDAIDNLYR